MHRGRSGAQVPVGCHHAYEQQRLGRAPGRRLRSAVVGDDVLRSLGRRGRAQRSQSRPAEDAAATAAATAAGVQAEPVIGSAAERVADEQSQDDAG